MSRNQQRLGRSMDDKYVKRRQRGIAVVVASVIVILGALIYIGVRIGTSSADYEGAGNGTTKLVEVPEGSSMSELGPTLVEKNVVKTQEAFDSAASMNHSASQIQPGFYRLQEEMSAA
ncbi:TPA: endolytic transglycosylase MltG, partial [Staphylococcus aureus]|nr:endolytic transglycosylase MltG [Staphylococcus aureus]